MDWMRDGELGVAVGQLTCKHGSARRGRALSPPFHLGQARTPRMNRIETLFRWSVAVLFLVAGAASAQSYPSKPVRLIVGYPAGGAADIVTRVVGQELAKTFGQPVIVENRPGAGGNLAADVVAKAAPDGYTILMGSISSNAINPSLHAKMPYDAEKDFIAVSLVASAPAVLVVGPDLQVNSFADLVALARKQPGKLSFASSGNGTTQHLAGELFKKVENLDMVHAPYKGVPAAILDLLSGRISMMFSPAPLVLQHVKDGRLKALAITSPKRSPLLPDVPTAAEVGLPALTFGAWNGVFVPAGTPPDIVNLLNREVVRIVEMPEVSERLSGLGFDAGGNTPAQFAAMVNAEISRWAKVVRESGARVD